MLVDVWKRGMLFGILGWLAVAAGAVTVGLLAVTLVGSGLTSGSSQPLSSDGVSRALGATSPSPSASASASPVPTPTQSPSPSQSPPATPSGTTTKPFTSAGGTAYAQCTGDQAYLTSWSPHPGYETDEVERGPDSRVSVRFEADDAKIRIIIRCTASGPRATTETDTDD